MSQVNVNTPPPRRTPPPRPPSRWPLYAFIAILIVVIGAALALTVGRKALGSANPTATPTVPATPTKAAAAGAATATPGPANTATPAPGGAPAPTATPGGATPTAAPASQPPTNPTAMQVVSGSCSVHRIMWSWSGAQRATSYDVVIYNPISGATVKTASVASASYTLPAGPGATVALKVRSRNSAGTASNFFTPESVGRVPPATTNPTNVTVTTSGHTLNWSWTAVPHATAYDLVLYHYEGSTAKDDVKARTTQAHWSIAVTPGITYRLKVRSVGPCAPPTYFTPSTAAAGK